MIEKPSKKFCVKTDKSSEYSSRFRQRSFRGMLDEKKVKNLCHSSKCLEDPVYIGDIRQTEVYLFKNSSSVIPFSWISFMSTSSWPLPGLISSILSYPPASSSSKRLCSESGLLITTVTGLLIFALWSLTALLSCWMLMISSPLRS